ncbi:phosphate signaling complex PhoU family protein [Corynebacterium aquatimens]|uniref:phosphate signaling complex PhoU family protein n=2 Tax=Corynebacterium TaxID=1716 RepID=UPI002540A068|nr:PhoU domain-containing protein [Corynebacterium aquatimens]
MCELARVNLLHATRALLDQDLEAAEDALTGSDTAVEIHCRCEDRALKLLARQSPVASDLRRVLAYIHIETDLERMSNLAKLIAKVARQHHPSPALPDDVTDRVRDMATAAERMAGRASELIATGELATDELVALDDTVDNTARDLTRLTCGNWDHSSRQAVELALICRYYERFADHCVAIARQVDFMANGPRER